MIRKLASYFVFVIICFRAAAQEEFIEPPSKWLTRVSFHQLTGGVILLTGQIIGYPDTLNFVLDTGSGGISLDSSTAEYLKMKPQPTNRTIRTIAGIRQVSFVNNQKLRLGTLEIDSLNFHINDYEILNEVYGERVDGIIGYSVLSRYIFKINYDSSFFDIYSNGTMNYPRGGYLLKPQIPTLPVQAARVKDAKTLYGRFLFDIGAGLNMMLTKDFVNDSSLLMKKRKLFYKEAEGPGGKIDMQLTVIKEVKVGPYKFRNVPVYIFKDDYNITSYPFLAGILGNDILRRFNCIINYDKRDIYLLPNSHFQEPFDYSYSGVELYYIDDQIIIGDVAKGSPAEAAGLKEGDIVIAINKALDQSLQTLKATLQNAGDKVKIIVRRGTELMEFEFKVRSIL